MGFFVFLFLLISIVAFCVFIFRLFDDNSMKQSLRRNKKIFNSSFLLLAICFFLLFVTTCHTNNIIEDPNILDFDYTKVGAYGDLVGGILNPIVAFIGIVAASLAFYVQYKANTQVQKQFRIQQFESQFYEMLRLHKENVNEMKITGYGISSQESIQYNKVDEEYLEESVSAMRSAIL